MRARSALLGLALAAAFSPALASFVGQLAARPWSRYCLVFLPLIALELPAAARRSGREASLGAGAPWIVGGLALELLALAGGLERVSRLALAPAAIGWCRAAGLGSPRTDALWLFAVPVPTAAAALASPGLERALAAAAAFGVRGCGGTLRLEGTRLVGPEGELALEAWDGGAAAAVLLAGLVWWRGGRAGWPAATTAARAAGVALLALPCQAVGFGVAATALATGHAALAREVLTHGPWALALVGFVAHAHGRERGRDPDHV